MSEAVVYRMRDTTGALLYVGCSGNLPTRLQQHARTQGWWPSVASIEVEHFDGMDDALSAEKATIRSEAPTHNVVHKSLTADEIAERRARREATKAERRRSFEKYLLETNYWSPAAGEVIRCGNCGRQPRRFPKGTALPEIPCKRCGVAAFERQAA